MPCPLGRITEMSQWPAVRELAIAAIEEARSSFLSQLI